ncbi:triose-phosphate isomerase [Sulfolobales archaeon HS-7]|nr:triose-phosphate isomerase [Sulfolobales archaeon HS-7]
MKRPSIILNFKAYPLSYGKDALKLAKIAEKVSRERSIEVILAVPFTEIFRISQSVENPIFAQHVEHFQLGAYTGYILPEMIKDAGAKGALINHSEHRITIDAVVGTIKRLKENGLESVVCLQHYELVHPIAILSPSAILIEPPELIGKGKAISKERPELITRAVDEVKKTPDVILIAGAGITSGADVYEAIKLGADGVGLASAFMLSKDPEAVLRDMVDGALRAFDNLG